MYVGNCNNNNIIIIMNWLSALFVKTAHINHSSPNTSRKYGRELNEPLLKK